MLITEPAKFSVLMVVLSLLGVANCCSLFVPQAGAAISYRSLRLASEVDLSEVAAQKRVVQNADDWKAFFEANRLGVAPEIDFSKQTAALVFLGGQPSQGYSLEIEAVTRERKEGRETRTIRLIEWIPDPSQPFPAETVFPYQIVILPREDSPLLFCSCQKQK